MEHKGTRELSSGRLILRRFQPEDAPAMYRNWASDPEVTAFLRWPPHESPAVTESVVRGWVESYADPRFYQWAIVPQALGEPIGSISVVDLNEMTHTVHIGYCIGRAFWHQGYTSEALRTVLPFLFREVKARRVESWHDPENPRSGQVMIRCGMHFEGILRQADWSSRGIVDATVYSLLSSEFEAMAGEPS